MVQRIIEVLRKILGAAYTQAMLPASLPNKPLNLSVPPQGNRSMIEGPGACGGTAG
jgi:hypothetical protein